MRHLKFSVVLMGVYLTLGCCGTPGSDRLAAGPMLGRVKIDHFNLLAWYDYDGQSDRRAPERARFVLNGFEEGRGKPGLRQALRDLSIAPKGTVVCIAFDRTDEGPSRPQYQMPYKDLDEAEWDRVMESGNLVVIYVLGDF